MFGGRRRRDGNRMNPDVGHVGDLELGGGSVEKKLFAKKR